MGGLGRVSFAALISDALEISGEEELGQEAAFCTEFGFRRQNDAAALVSKEACVKLGRV